MKIKFIMAVTKTKLSVFFISEHAVHCGFEYGLSGMCGALKPNQFFDDVQGSGRRWDIVSSGAAEGSNYWNAFTDFTGSLQVGTMSIIPMKVGGKDSNYYFYPNYSYIGGEL